ncbi:hypothetical protein PUNSTDRAFT_143904 [Punctularia strigosozonata HHB-11173 SS5]|uniref:uncharacterized protein n=1 Tax=Punctularia strigosozonata (strain HHB-11173) TaxID=741275 RepID=UPI00044169FF|nr:uncharacterized protein PUNSTDRAFT_143904 [Punctularia strigosozonata HHB-11173 SS5]EIN08264.1 hypothetical protein PUNSTDRAFT_143904 [Punctularia strigosozonata HHB-11173 SS5]
MPYTLATTGLSLYSIPAAYFAALYPHILKNILIQKTIGLNNVHPRSQLKRLEEKNPTVFARADRMYSAHVNGNEIFPLWAAAVLAGNYAGLSPETLNTFALAFIGSRVLYNTIYISDSLNRIAGGRLRSLVWMISVVTPLTLLFKAANKLSA